MLQSRIQLRFVQMRELPVYAIAIYIDNSLVDVGFHGARIAQQIHDFDRSMQTILDLGNMDSYERERLLRPVLLFCEHVKQVRIDLSMIIAARLLTESPQSGFQQIWDRHRDKVFWEREIMADYEPPLLIGAKRSELVETGVLMPPGPSRIRVRLPQRSEHYQQVAELLRAGAARAPSPETSILGFDRVKPGGHRQIPEPMTRDQWEFVKKTGELPGAMNWNIAEQQQLAAKLEDPF
jgi:hypothetical protein